MDFVKYRKTTIKDECECIQGISRTNCLFCISGLLFRYNKKMKVIVALFVVFAAAYAMHDTDEFEVAEDEVGEQYFLVPVRHFRR